MVLGEIALGSRAYGVLKLGFSRTTKVAKPIDEAQRCILASVSTRTLKEYRWFFARYVQWLADQGEEVPLPLSLEHLEEYVLLQAKKGLGISALQITVSGVRFMNILEGHAAQNGSRLNHILNGIRKEGPRVSKKLPVTQKLLLQICSSMEPTIQHQRDRALLTLGWFSTLRRSELVELDHKDLVFHDEGMTLHAARVKNLPQGREVEVPFDIEEAICPVRSTKAWFRLRKKAGFTEGPAFLRIDCRGVVQVGRPQGRIVARILKRHLSRLGFDPSVYSATSLRRGFITDAAQKQTPVYQIAKRTGHQSPQGVWSYIQFDDLKA